MAQTALTEAIQKINEHVTRLEGLPTIIKEVAPRLLAYRNSLSTLKSLLPKEEQDLKNAHTHGVEQGFRPTIGHNDKDALADKYFTETFKNEW